MQKILQKQKALENYSVISIVKHNACLEHIVEDLQNLTKDFNQMDYVVISGGLRNALMGGKVEETVFQYLSQIGIRTNLIIFSLPLWERIVLNRFIDQINIKLYTFVQNANGGSTFINVNSFLNSSSFFFQPRDLVLKYTAKKAIADKIAVSVSKTFLG